MIHGDERHSLHLGVKYKVYSPFGAYALSAPSNTSPLWRTKGAFRALMSDDFSLSVTAVIKAERTSLRKLPRVTLTVHLTFRGEMFLE